MLKPAAQLKVCVAYVCVTNGNMTDSYAPRFAQTYLDNPAGIDHRLIVVCNGGELSLKREKYFDKLDCEFLSRENDGGFDISAYQEVARDSGCDFLVCLGESVYFYKPDWLLKLVQARLKYGPGMYGFFATHAALAHLNTSAFGVDAPFLAKYPPVLNHGARYEFEHGSSAMWRRIVKGGGRAIYVTWNGEYAPGHWRDSRNGLNEGTQKDLMVLCNHTDRYEAANENTRSVWCAGANAQFR